MRYSTQVKPISYVKASATKILLDLAESQEPMIITQNGEAKAVLQDIVSYEATQDTLALLKILALADEDIAAGRTVTFRETIAKLKAKHRHA